MNVPVCEDKVCKRTEKVCEYVKERKHVWVKDTEREWVYKFEKDNMDVGF